MPPKKEDLKAGVDADGEELQFWSEQLTEFSNLGRTIDGSGVAYRTAACSNSRIGVIKGIEQYTHLHHLDMSDNSVKDVSYLKTLRNLLKLNMSKNCVPNLKAWDPGEEGDELFPVLTHLNADRNLLAELRPLPFKSLKVASFRGNEIQSCQDFAGHEVLESLVLAGNKIKTVAGLANMPALTQLDLSGNLLEDLSGLGELPALKELNLAENKFQALEGPWQELASAPLESLDLSKNLLESGKPLEALRHLAKLRRLGVAGNPFMSGEDGLVQVLVAHWMLTSVDGRPVTKEQLALAGEANVARLEEAREQAKAEEEAAAAGAG